MINKKTGGQIPKMFIPFKSIHRNYFIIFPGSTFQGSFKGLIQK